MLDALSLLAQAPPFPAPPAPGPTAFPVELFLIGGIAFLIIFLINGAICYMLYICQKAVPPEHRRMEPGQVWLLLIPLFNLIWNFIVFQRIPESYQSYFYSRGRTDVGDAGKGLGLWYAICSICAFVPCVGSFAGLAGLVLLIMFLVKVMQYRGQVGLVAPGGFPVGYAGMGPPPPPLPTGMPFPQYPPQYPPPPSGPFASPPPPPPPPV